MARHEVTARKALAATLALVGFAANSLLCRAALGTRSIDPFSFTAVRIGAGAATLVLLARTSSDGARIRGRGSPGSAVALFAYAAAFSLAYVRIQAGVGALVLFTCVQATMIAAGIRGGERPSAIEWLGLAVALGGLAVLTLPGASVPDGIGLVLMAAAGVAWGVYTLRGRGNQAPLLATADNFMLAAPLAAAMLAVGASTSALRADAHGIVLALLSGAIASGVGYSLWYLALPALGTVRAAMLQLTVPVIAATGGIVLLRESVTPRLLVAGVLILSGVGSAIVARNRAGASKQGDGGEQARYRASGRE
jgi:drug/metabolite transporter (DMT)-like permease